MPPIIPVRIDLVSSQTDSVLHNVGNDDLQAEQARRDFGAHLGMARTISSNIIASVNAIDPAVLAKVGVTQQQAADLATHLKAAIDAVLP